MSGRVNPRKVTTSRRKESELDRDN